MFPFSNISYLKKIEVLCNCLFFIYLSFHGFNTPQSQIQLHFYSTFTTLSALCNLHFHFLHYTQTHTNTNTNKRKQSTSVSFSAQLSRPLFLPLHVAYCFYPSIYFYLSVTSPPLTHSLCLSNFLHLYRPISISKFNLLSSPIDLSLSLCLTPCLCLYLYLPHSLFLFLFSFLCLFFSLSS